MLDFGQATAEITSLSKCARMAVAPRIPCTGLSATTRPLPGWKAALMFMSSA